MIIMKNENYAYDKSDKEKMLAEFESLDYSTFGIYDENGINVGIVNRAIVRRCIDVGYVFDLEHIPQGVVDKVISIDCSVNSLNGWLVPPHEIVKPSDYYKVPKRRSHHD